MLVPKSGENIFAAEKARELKPMYAPCVLGVERLTEAVAIKGNVSISPRPKIKNVKYNQPSPPVKFSMA